MNAHYIIVPKKILVHDSGSMKDYLLGGYSQILSINEYRRQGPTIYLSPEPEYDPVKTPVWQIGLFAILILKKKKRLEQISLEDIEYYSKVDPLKPFSVNTFISQCLEPDLELRPSIEELLGDRYFVQIPREDSTPKEKRRKIGEGNQGEVFLVKNGEESIALKIIKVNKDNRNMLKEELYACQKLNKSEHVVKLINCYRNYNFFYLYLEYCNSKSLREIIGECQLSQIYDIGMQIALGVQEMHAVGVMHRDIKPDNIFLHKSSKGILLAKLGDLGHAKFSMDGLLASKNRGSEGYKAPEIPIGYWLSSVKAKIPYTSKVDIWSLGMVFYEMLYHGLPSEEEVLEHRIKYSPNIKYTLINNLIQYCLQEKVENRYSIEQVLHHDFFKSTPAQYFDKKDT